MRTYFPKEFIKAFVEVHTKFKGITNWGLLQEKYKYKNV